MASLASMGLSHAIARGILHGLTREKTSFVVTAKSRRLGGSNFAAFAPVREEVLMAIALFLCIAGMGAALRHALRRRRAVDVHHGCTVHPLCLGRGGCVDCAQGRRQGRLTPKAAHGGDSWADHDGSAKLRPGVSKRLPKASRMETPNAWAESNA